MKIKMESSILLTVLLFMAAEPVGAINIKISDTRENNFYLEALFWVLEKSGKEYNIIHTKHPVSSQRRKIELVKKGEIDILYAGTSLQLEKELLPIRFPVMRGLIGRRIFIIHGNYQSEYGLVKNLNGLKKFIGIQGIGWGDKQVLEASGLKQVEGLYDDIFRKIDAGSRYYFPRGITEVFSELIDKKITMPNLETEKSILLVYKTAVFFFVNPSNTELANMIKTGFLNAYEDGSYNRFFYGHPLIESSFEKANLKKRIKIEIPNPFLSSETDAIPRRYWHQD